MLFDNQEGIYDASRRLLAQIDFVFSSQRLNKGLKEFEGRDRAFIVRFTEDNSYVTLDYRSSAIVQQDLVERLGLSKNDKIVVRCSGGEYTGKVWFLGTNAEVKSKEKEAEQIMRRIEDGESLNLSEISLSHCQSFERFEQQQQQQLVSESPNPSTQDEVDSDCEAESLPPPKKRINLQTLDNPAANDNGKDTTNAELKCVLEQILHCLLRVEDKVEKSRCAHENCESRWRKNVKDFKAITKTQNLIVEWMQRNNNFVAPATEEQAVSKMFEGRDLLSYPGEVPSLYGRNIARVLWSKEELVSCIMSPGKDLEYMQSPRTPMSPKRKALFRECIEQKFSSVPGAYVKGRNSVNQLGTEIKSRMKSVNKGSPAAGVHILTETP